MSMKSDVAKLDTLVVATIDSIRGYEHLASHAQAGRYADFLRSMAAERRNVVAHLQSASRTLGGIPANYASTAAVLHRRWDALHRVLDGGDRALVHEIERVENDLKEDFERAMQERRLYPDTRELIAICYEAVLRGYHRANALAHQFEFAS